MNSFQEESSERKAVEEYLKLYCIEELIDEALNCVLETRPSNPYVEIAKLIASKTFPEIIDVKIRSICTANANGGIQALIITNLGTFEATVGETIESPPGSDRLKDYVGIENKASTVLKSIDPRDMNKVDELISSIPGIDSQVCLSLSIACCRAAAHHKGLPLYKYISEMAQSGTIFQI